VIDTNIKSIDPWAPLFELPYSGTATCRIEQQNKKNSKGACRSEIFSIDVSFIHYDTCKKNQTTTTIELLRGSSQLA